jgi:hypothetical protein
MLEDVEASTFVDRCKQKKQRKKKRDQLLYSTPKQLERSRMQRSNVLPRFSANHGESSRTLALRIQTLRIVHAKTIVCSRSSRGR